MTKDENAMPDSQDFLNFSLVINDPKGEMAEERLRDFFQSRVVRVAVIDEHGLFKESYAQKRLISLSGSLLEVPGKASVDD